MADVYRICQQANIKLWPNTRNHVRSFMLPPRETWAKRSIKRIAQRGESIGQPDHVLYVLDMLCGSRTGQCMLFGDVIEATSLWMWKKEIRSSEIPFIAPLFDQIELADLHSRIVAHGIPKKAPQIASWLCELTDAELTELRS